MKSSKYIVIIILPLLLLSSKCAEKNKNKSPNILRGRIMNDCTTPASNVAIKLKADAIGPNQDKIETFTDADGYFELSYIPKASSYTLFAPNKLMEFIPSKPELDLGEINKGGTVNFIIKLQVNNNYNENNTLFYYNRNYPQNSNIPWLKIPGPFYSGELDTVINASYFGTYIFNQPNQLYTSYYINNHLNDIQKYFDVSFCTSSFSEVVLVID